MIPVISIIICTHNRADTLANCIESLITQNVTQDIYEVIIIDNASSDHTYEFCQKILIENPNFKYYFEKKLGLSNARNRGWQEATGNYIAYIDDDAIAYPDWLLEMYNYIKKCPEASVFGGPYDGYSTVGIPEWFPLHYFQHNLGNEDKIIEVGREWIHGSNMVFKKNVLSNHGGFMINIGMRGNKLSYGEDTRLIKDLSDLGYKIHYVSKMKVKHFMPKEKISLWWVLKRNYIEGTTSSKTFKEEYSFFVFCDVAKNCFLFFKRFMLLDKMPLKRRMYYSLRGLFYSIGVLVEKITDSYYKIKDL